MMQLDDVFCPLAVVEHLQSLLGPELQQVAGLEISIQWQPASLCDESRADAVKIVANSVGLSTVAKAAV
jgi:hypothetical protein